MPSYGVNVPARHSEHIVDAALEYWPAEQVEQTEAVSAAIVAENVPAGQIVQLDAAVSSLKVPAEHWVQVEMKRAPVTAE